MVYYLNIIFFAVAVIAFVIAVILAIIGSIFKKSKDILANITLVLIVVSCISTLGLVVSDTVYINKVKSCIKSEYENAHRFNNKGSLSMFECDGTYYEWKYNAKANTIIVKEINSDSNKELKDAL